MHNQQSDPHWFGELLAVLHNEELIRLRRRLENQGNSRLVEILTDELEEREPNLWNQPLNSSKADPNPSTL